MNTDTHDPIICVQMGRGTWQGPASAAPVIHSPVDQLVREMIGTHDLGQLALARNAISRRMQELIDQQMRGAP